MPGRITVISPVQDLLFWKLSGKEALSEPFKFTVTLLSTAAQVDSASLLGKPLTVSLPLQNFLSVRHLNGKITRVATGAQELDGTRYASYTLTLESDLWPMQRDRNLRIFQEQTVPQIVKTLLNEYQVQVEDKLSGSYRSWEYCVQYQESSFDFISRLMELEGISYFFRHEEGSHTLVLTDSPEQFKPFDGYEIIPYHQTPGGGVTGEEGIAAWEKMARVTPGLYSVDDYDFRKPNAWLLQARQNPTSPQPGGIDVYEWPGRYVEHGHGEFYARIRQQRWAVEHHQLRGTATASGLCPGCTFTLIKAPTPGDNGEYLITGVDYEFEENRYASGGESTRHQLKFSALPADIPFRPDPRTRWPRTYGPQTAKVVGPAGESIWTDRFGRVKVKFHWDREAKGDDTSSCWIRVSSAWAGQGYGGVQIPRVGDEVIVDFINGDPDRPIITGRVYNEASMPPWGLPGAATQMGFMSRTKDGTPANANMLRFEDKAGAEQVFIQAERNMDTSVKNDESHSVGANRTKNVAGNETTTVKQNRTETVDGNQNLTIGKNQAETVSLNKAESIGVAKALSVGAAYQTTVGMAMNTSVGLSQSSQVGVEKSLWVGENYSVDVGQALSCTVGVRKTETVGQVSVTNAGDHLELVCGQARIVLTSDGGIYLQGKHIELLAENALNGDAAMTQWNCGATQAPPSAPGE
ncbi:type VI secretion system Vgr family protein [Mixta intestinalis]|uniref:Actin cross-linking toxin VgrG1 n=2 Tax=Mixta TaxID=2100764 RepID=A0A6P1Q090_9GAMM|nr:type VI secretion system tip protein TssI/VgrG [Mixta intestinalis]QHM71831.1 Actin cross-linking toxin VgrG1 [Mixta intestinalis]